MLGLLSRCMTNEHYTLILLFIACIAGFWIILKFSSGRISAQYRLLAERFDLELDQPPARFGGFVRKDPAAYGQYRGREISFSAPGKGIKGSRQSESVLKLELRNRRLTAQLAPAGFLGGLSQRDHNTGKQGRTRWKSGDETFDQAVDIRTNDPSTLAAALTDEKRAWLAGNLKRSKASIYIGDGVIAYAKLGLIADDATRQKFEETVEFLCEFAETAEG